MIYHGTQAPIGQNIYFVAEWKIYYQPLIVQFNKEAYTNDQIILKNFNTNLVPSLNSVKRQTIHGPTTAESIGQLLDSPPNPTLCNGPILPTPPLNEVLAPKISEASRYTNYTNYPNNAGTLSLSPPCTSLRSGRPLMDSQPEAGASRLGVSCWSIRRTGLECSRSFWVIHDW